MRRVLLMLTCAVCFWGLSTASAQAFQRGWQSNSYDYHSWRHPSYYRGQNSYSYSAPRYQIQPTYVIPYNYNTFYGPQFYGPTWGNPYYGSPGFQYQYQYWYGY